MTPPDKLYDDEGLTPAQVKEIDALIALHEANKNAPRLAVPDEELSPVTEAERGRFGDCVTSVKYWDDMADTLFDPEMMARLESGFLPIGTALSPTQIDATN